MTKLCGKECDDPAGESSVAMCLPCQFFQPLHRIPVIPALDVLVFQILTGISLASFYILQTTAEEHKESRWTAWLVISHAPLLPSAALSCETICSHFSASCLGTNINISCYARRAKATSEIKSPSFFFFPSIILYMFKNLSKES